MAEYIEREAALSVIRKLNTPAKSPAQKDMLRTASVYIQEIPAADVVPVVHGRWVHTAIEDDDWGGTFHSWTCSNCDFSTGKNQNGTNYCPNCGAKMDAEE